MANRFFGDLLTHLFDRRGWRGSSADDRALPELAEALLSAEGEVSGLRIAATLLDRYSSAGTEERRDFFLYLNDALDIDATRLSQLAQTYAAGAGTDVFRALSRAAEPRRQELLRRLNQPPGATRALVDMRVDLLAFLKDHPDLARTDHDFRHLLRSWFNRGFLVLQQIDWDTPARILDKVVAYEAVHHIADLDDLRRRLDPADRRCFAFFHPSMPQEPLIFVEVALTSETPSSIDALLADPRDPLDPSDASVAVFYSISNCQKGLAGISFGNLLIKQVVSEIAAEWPGIDTFVTLSPIPKLSDWLLNHDVTPDDLDPEQMRAAAAHYLLHASRQDGMPYDPVARFHLGNGAEVHAVHASADSSTKGQAQSGGVMVNYLYDLSKTERHHEDFATGGVVTATKEVQTLADAPLPQRTKEPSL